MPEIHDVRAGGTEIVMERIDGPMMMDAMLREPWQMGRVRARARRSARPAARDPRARVAAAIDDGDRLVHLDLHPLNVMITASGPVVIDWTNAARGDALTDVAVTFMLLTCPRIPGSRIVNVAATPMRAVSRRAFAARYRGRALDEQLVFAARDEGARREHVGRRSRRVRTTRRTSASARRCTR